MLRKFLLLIVLLASLNIKAQEAKSLTLQECIQIAIENNLNMKRGRLNLEGTSVNLSQTKASRYPTANVSLGFNNNWGRSIDPTSNDFIAQRITTTGLSGNSNVTLFNGLRQVNSVKQGNIDVDAAEYDLEKIKNDLVLDIASMYLNVIFNKELVENAQFQVQTGRRQLERTQKLVASGALPRTNELELVSQVASNEVNLVNQQNALDLALLSLKQSMLLPASEEIDIVVPDVDALVQTSVDAETSEIYENSLSTLPEIKSADLGIESARLGVKIAEGGRFPSLGVGGGFSSNYSDAFQTFEPTGTEAQQVGFTSGGDDVFVFNPTGEFSSVSFGDQIDQNLSYFLGVQLSIPIFNGLQTESDIQRSKIQLQQAEITAIEQRNTLRQQIETANANVIAASKAFDASARQVEALEETFRSIENQYNLGAVNFTDYQVASNNLYGARSDLTRAKYDYVFKMKILEFYQGIPLTFDQ